MIPLFDLGNVLVRLDFSPFERWAAKISGADPALILKRLMGSTLWIEFEHGNIDSGEFVRRAGGILGARFKEEEFREMFCSIFPGPVPGMDELIAELRKPVYCLTNTNKMHYDFLTDGFRWMGGLTEVFASHEIRRRKPWPDTYRAVAERICVPPHEVVFFDDVEANVAGARKAGMRAYLFESAEQVKRILEEKS